MKYMLVKAPKDKGYHLSHQTPKIYVSGRPHIVKNDNQVQLGSARDCIILLGETTMTDEDFRVAYEKDPKKAIEAALKESPEVDLAAATEAKKAAKEDQANKAKKAKEEEDRLALEAKNKADAKAAAEGA